MSPLGLARGAKAPAIVGERVGRTILLRGRPGVGKTTIIKEVVENLGGQAGGFYTEEVREGGQRQGFKIVTLDGQEGVLAHVDIKGQPRVSRYGVNLKELEEVGVAALKRALECYPLVVIDEIGKMELFSEAFRAAVFEAIEGEKMVLATVMAGYHPWVEMIKAHPAVKVLEVTMSNRQTMAKQILDMLGEGA